MESDGLITNTIILKDLADQYGQLRGLLQRYLDISDKELVVEVDGDTFDDFMYAAEAAYSMSDRVLIKVPTKKIGIQAHARLRDLGVKTMATTVFSLSQAILAARPAPVGSRRSSVLLKRMAKTQLHLWPRLWPHFETGPTRRG